MYQSSLKGCKEPVKVLYLLEAEEKQEKESSSSKADFFLFVSRRYKPIILVRRGQATADVFR